MNTFQVLFLLAASLSAGEYNLTNLLICTHDGRGQIHLLVEFKYNHDCACCVLAQSLDYKALTQFRRMILCVMPDSWPVFDYSDYGCYCGKGGSGTPVDDLDRSWSSHDWFSDYLNKNLVQSVSKCVFSDFLACRCCEVHDKCYNDAMQHPECWPILDNPYTEFYDYSCDKENKKVTCGSEYTKTKE